MSMHQLLPGLDIEWTTHKRVENAIILYYIYISKQKCVRDRQTSIVQMNTESGCSRIKMPKPEHQFTVEDEQDPVTVMCLYSHFSMGYSPSLEDETHSIHQMFHRALCQELPTHCMSHQCPTP